MKPDKLKLWRKEQKLSQAELAVLLGIHVMTVSRWERGVCAIPVYVPLALKGIKVR